MNGSFDAVYGFDETTILRIKIPVPHGEPFPVERSNHHSLLALDLLREVGLSLIMHAVGPSALA